MDDVGLGTDLPSVADIQSGASALGLPAFSDLIGALLGQDRFQALCNQGETDFKQFGTNVPDRRNWSGILADQSTPEYFFLLRYGGQSVQIPFNVNPQREIVTHPHAMTVAYTQGGGKIINSEGMTTKDITIQGMCGLYPNQGTKIKPASGVGSGFEQVKFLENLFQRYCFLKRFGDVSKSLQLVYVNRKFQDAWVVEPKSFTREDAVEHNFNFSYTIVLETLYPYDGSDAKSVVENLLSLIPGFSTIDNVVQGIGEAVDDLNAAIGQIEAIAAGAENTILGEFLQLAQAYADLKAIGSTQNKAAFKKSTTQAIITNLVNIANTLEAAGAPMALVSSVVKAENWAKKSLLQDSLYNPSPKSQTATVTQIQQDQAAASINADGSLVSPAEAAAVGAVTTKPTSSQLVAGVNNPALAQPGSSTLQTMSTNQNAIQALKATNPTLSAQLAAAYASTQSAKAITTVGTAIAGSNGNLSMSSPRGSGQTVTAPGASPVALSGPLSPYSIVPPSLNTTISQKAWTSTFNSDLAAIDPSNSNYKTATVNQGDDIQTIALRLLGDPGKWPQLVMLNNLKYPYVASQSYITANGLSNVIPWLSPILYAAPKSTSVAQTSVYRNETATSLALTAFQRAMGNDIYIDPSIGDAVWGTNDLVLTYGLNNLKQVIRFRVTLVKGKLRRAITLGLTDFRGTANASIEVIRSESRGLFNDLSIIDSAQAVDIEQQANVLIVWMRVNVRDLQNPIVVPVTLAA